MATFRTKVVGVTFEGRQATIRALKAKWEIDTPVKFRLRREPENSYDHNAVAVYADGEPIGFLPRDIAAQVAPVMDKGAKTKCWEPLFAAAGTNVGVSLKVRVRKLVDVEGVQQRFVEE